MIFCRPFLRCRKIFKMDKKQRWWIRVLTIILIAVFLSLITTQRNNYITNPLSAQLESKSNSKILNKLENFIDKYEKLLPQSPHKYNHDKNESDSLGSNVENQLAHGKSKELKKVLSVETKISSEKKNPPRKVINKIPDKNKKATLSSTITVKTTTSPKTKPPKLEINQNQNKKSCPINYSKDFKTDIVPMINLRPDYFIYPMLSNGPNNQLMSLREAIFLAIKLNRTVVVPNFRKHKVHTPVNESSTIDETHRVDWNFVQKLVPLSTKANYNESCNSTYDAIFRAEGVTPRMYWRINTATNLKFYLEPTEKNLKKSEYPLGRVLKPAETLHFNASSIKSLFQTEKRCAIYGWPYKTLLITKNSAKTPRPSSIDLKKISDVDLFSEVIRFCRAPPHIYELADDFIKSKIGSFKFMSVHWRFDKNDWFKKCQSPPKSLTEKSRHRLCDTVEGFTDEDLVTAIDNKAKSIPMLKLRKISVYIATPPAEQLRIDRVAKILRRKNYRIFTGDSLREFWKDSYQECDWLWPDFEDLLSSTEMVVCQKALVFSGSITSSWTANVEYFRTEETISKKFLDLDTNIFQLVRREFIKRTNTTPSWG